jgi:hypothetical protein
LLEQIALGSVLLVVTTFVHSGCTLGALAVLRRSHAARHLGSIWSRVSLVAALVVMMFVAAVLESSTWAALYVMVGAFSSFEPALYFSTVTFTTLGYGDLVLDERWRLLGSFEAANGTIMFGWTTALIFAFVQRMAAHDQSLARHAGS